MWKQVLILVTCIAFVAVSVASTPTRIRFGKLGNYLLFNSLRENSCGSDTALKLCRDCMEATTNENAFRFCCNDEFGVRDWCKSYLEYTLERR